MMKSRRLQPSKSYKNTIYSTSRTREGKESADKPRKDGKACHKKSVTQQDRQEKDMMIERIQNLDLQYKKLYENYNISSRKTKNLVDQNEDWKAQCQKLTEQNKDQRQKLRQLTQQTNKALYYQENAKVLKIKVEELDLKYMLEREKRLLLEAEREKWQGRRGRMIQEYERILDAIEEIKVQVAE